MEKLDKPYLQDILLPQVAKEVAAGLLAFCARLVVHLDHFLVPVRIALLVYFVQAVLREYNFLGPWMAVQSKSLRNRQEEAAEIADEPMQQQNLQRI